MYEFQEDQPRMQVTIPVAATTAATTNDNSDDDRFYVRIEVSLRHNKASWVPVLHRVCRLSEESANTYAMLEPGRLGRALTEKKFGENSRLSFSFLTDGMNTNRGCDAAVKYTTAERLQEVFLCVYVDSHKLTLSPTHRFGVIFLCWRSCKHLEQRMPEHA